MITLVTWTAVAAAIGYSLSYFLMFPAWVGALLGLGLWLLLLRWWWHMDSV